MTEQDILDRAKRAAMSVDGPDHPYDALLRRRDRKRRNQRIAAGVVGIAVFVAAVWIVTSAWSFDRTQRPASEPSRVSPTHVAEDAVRGFLAAFGAFDSERAMTYVADDADFLWWIGPGGPANERGLSLSLALFEAVGYQQTITSCHAVPFGSGTSVLCRFDFTTIRSDELGRGPFTGGEFLFTVREGAIVQARLKTGIQFWSQMFQPFAVWVSVRYPRDVDAMFTEPDIIPAGHERFWFGNFGLTQESIRLWRLRTREYMQSVEQGTA
jgi:hypothetical protein